MNEDFHNAQVEWDADGQPLSHEFGDVYFSKANGLEETRHVFLQHNHLAERWQRLTDNQHFTIAETGFGSGLNFLAAWDLWLKTAPISARLHFVSVEKFPLHKTDLTRALSLWPELAELANPLINAYPVFVGTGFHRLKFIDGRISLTLIIDDATTGFTKLLASTHPLYAKAGFKVDAWFLDGFAPSKNPQMWSNQLFDVIHKLSDQKTTVATFSAAAIVKNGLKAAGFHIEKVTGFGRKREMVKARFQREREIPNPEDYRYPGSFSPYPVPWTIQPNNEVKAREVVIIGGGLAGCHTAHALAERGWKVILLERHGDLAQEGSGNPQGALYAKLSPLEEAQATFNLTALQYALQMYRPLWPKIGEQCGLLQLAYKPTEQKLHEELRERFATAGELVEFVTAARASELAGVEVDYSGLFFPQAGWINPRHLCSELINHVNIHVKYNSQVIDFKATDNGWLVELDSDTQLQTQTLIIASAKEALKFTDANHLPAKAIRGQVTYLPQTATSPRLTSVICAEGYISPAQHGRFCSGATFNLKDESTDVRTSDHDTNLANLRQHLPKLAQHWAGIDTAELQGRVAFRCALPDYLPAVGSLPVVDDLLRDFAPLRKNARAGITSAGSYYSGLYINIGYGARGLAYTPICAELLASYINREPLPMPQELANALNPARFIIRDLIKNKR